jgi:hypothetical protein
MVDVGQSVMMGASSFSANLTLEAAAHDTRDRASEERTIAV